MKIKLNLLKSRDIRESEGEFIDITPKIQRKKRFRRKKVKFLPKEEETEEVILLFYNI